MVILLAKSDAHPHVLAMTAPGAAGQRFIASSERVWMADVAGILRSELAAAADKAPTKEMPDLVLRIVAVFRRPVRFVVPLLGRKHVFTSAKARSALGWEPRPVATTVADSARSAMAVGAGLVPSNPVSSTRQVDHHRLNRGGYGCI